MCSRSNRKKNTNDGNCAEIKLKWKEKTRPSLQEIKIGDRKPSV